MQAISKAQAVDLSTTSLQTYREYRGNPEPKEKAKRLNNEPYDRFKNIDLQPFKQSIKEGLLYAVYSDESKVRHLQKGDVLVVNPNQNRVLDGGIFAFVYNGNILVRELQILPKIGRDYKAYRAVGLPHEEIYNADEVEVIGIVAGKIKELHHGFMFETNQQRR